MGTSALESADRTVMKSSAMETINRDGVSSQLDRWMTELPDGVRARPLHQLAIPGSHNSLSYALRCSGCPAEAAADLEPPLAGLYRCAPRLLRPLLARWAVTQQLDVAQQLAAGVRYLDVRAAWHTGALHVVHGLHGPPLAPLLADVRDFMAARPGELVILDLQHVYGLDAAGYAELRTVLRETFGDWLVPHGEAAPSLMDCAAAGQRVLTVYRGGGNFAPDPLLWDESALSSPWPDTQSARRLFPLLERQMARAARHTPGRLHVQQCVFTPQRRHLVLRAGSSLRRLAARCNAAVASWLPAQSVQRGLNIVMTDFVGAGEHPLVEMVVQKNYDL